MIPASKRAQGPNGAKLKVTWARPIGSDQLILANCARPKWQRQIVQATLAVVWKCDFIRIQPTCSEKSEEMLAQQHCLSRERPTQESRLKMRLGTKPVVKSIHNT